MHKCRAEGCRVQVRHEYLMCPRHWRMVPREIGVLVTRHWRAGETRGWKKAVSRAIYAVGVVEGIFRQLARGIYVHVAKNQVEMDIPDLLDVYGWEDTEANRDLAVEVAMDAAKEVWPDVPLYVTSDGGGSE